MKKRNLFFILLLTIHTAFTPSVTASLASSEDESQTDEEVTRYFVPPLTLPMSQSVPFSVQHPGTGSKGSSGDQCSFTPYQEQGMHSCSAPDPRELALLDCLKRILKDERPPSLISNRSPIFPAYTNHETDVPHSHKNFSDDPRSMEALDLDGTQPKSMVDILAKKAAYYKERYHNLQKAHNRLLSQFNASRMVTNTLEQELFFAKLGHTANTSRQQEESSSDEEDGLDLVFTLPSHRQDLREEKKAGGGVPSLGQ
ncbi:MAG: hypothetical protein H2057_08120 [Alphaproteobacteria bacterium]|nr:hypothetical protein [Alphaproteobacteria bacterium]